MRLRIVSPHMLKPVVSPVYWFSNSLRLISQGADGARPPNHSWKGGYDDGGIIAPLAGPHSAPF